MNPKIPVEELLRWRLARAEAEAPPVPRGQQLLELARPWWETWPERFREIVARLSQMEIAFGHAMAERRAANERLVPAIIVHPTAEVEMRVRLLYFSVRKGQVRLRFEFELCEDQRDCAEPAFEATFVCRMASRPLFSTSVERSANAEYSLAESLSKELADEWLGLKVTDEMPFRLVLRPLESGG